MSAATLSADAGSRATRPQPVAAPADLPSARKFLIFGIMAFGQFMALIDIQIVAASLNEVQAGLSAGPDEISWVQTGYLMAELVMIPFAAFLAQALSTRWLFVASAGLFTAASALCGAAWDIDSMILFRVIQGFVGGAMVPTVFATGFALFSGPQRAMIPAILGMVSVLAPTLGPTVGGWLTDTIGWRSIFYINIIPGIAVTALAASVIRVDLPNLSIAIVNTWLQDQTRIHFARMGEALGESGRHATQMITALADRIGQVTTDPAQALLLAQAELGQMVSRNALTLGFNEVFRMMSWMFLAALVMVPFCRPISNAAPPPPDAH